MYKLTKVVLFRAAVLNDVSCTFQKVCGNDLWEIFSTIINLYFWS